VDQAAKFSTLNSFENIKKEEEIEKINK